MSYDIVIPLMILACLLYTVLRDRRTRDESSTPGKPDRIQRSTLEQSAAVQSICETTTNRAELHAQATDGTQIETKTWASHAGSQINKDDAEVIAHEVISTRPRIDKPYTQGKPKVNIKKRVRVPLNQVQYAESRGFISLWFDGGHTDIVNLYIGLSQDDAELVGTLNTVNQFNGSVSALVRTGEYWWAESKRGHGTETNGVYCLFTPF